MTASLTLTGSVAALSAALAAFEAAQTGSPATDVVGAGNSPAGTQTASTDTGAGIPAPMPTPSVPSGVAATPPAPIPSTSPDSTNSEDEDEGDETDGTGVDADGLPWDERIHSSSKKKTARGVWAKRRGGPSGAELAAIEAELRGETQQPLPMPAPVASVEPVAAPAPPQPATPPVPMPAPPQPATPPVPMPAPTPAPAPVEEWDFAKLMTHMGPKMGSVIAPEYLAQVVQKFGLNAITDAATKPEVIGQLVAQFQADGVW